MKTSAIGVLISRYLKNNLSLNPHSATCNPRDFLYHSEALFLGMCQFATSTSLLEWLH